MYDLNPIFARAKEMSRARLGYDLRNATTDEALDMLQEVTPKLVEEIPEDQLRWLLSEELVERTLRDLDLIRDDNAQS